MRKCIERQSHNCRDVYAYDLENWCDGIPSVELVSSSEHWLLARAVGRSAPRPHRFRRMAPPLTGKSLILHPPTEGSARVAYGFLGHARRIKWVAVRSVRTGLE